MSMILDHPQEDSDSVNQAVHIPVINVEDMEVEAEEEPVLAIVPFVPPVMEPQNLIVAMIRIPAGPPLPPAMIWQRTFDSLYEEISTREVPKPLLLPPLRSIVCSKRSWSFAFDEGTSKPSLIYIGEVDAVEP